MANLQNVGFDVDDLPIHESLRAYEDEIPLLHGRHADTDWNDEMFGKIPIWSVDPLTNVQLSAIGREWLGQIMDGQISTRTAVNGLRLALSIKSMIPGTEKLLLTQQVRPANGTDLLSARVQIPNIEQFSNSIYTLRRHQQGVGEPVGVKAQPAGDYTEKQEIDSFCFLAFFMMRLIVKSPVNLVNAVRNMKSLYSSIYGPSRVISRFNITVPKAAAYKEALLGQDMIGLTFTHAVANTHQNHMATMAPIESRVLSYLGTQPLSYTGMHSYTLMLKLKVFSKASMRKVLSLFYCNVTAQAIEKIAWIEKHYERTDEHPNRSILFRYCTLWGPNYFTSVRSKNCVHLLYTVACAWKVISQGEENADPENIAATKTLSNSMKQTLKLAGTMIGESLKRKRLVEGDEIGADEFVKL